MNARAHRPRDFSAVSYREALPIAPWTLVPVLRARAAKMDAAATLLAETEADLHDSGLLRFVQPRRWGGMELDFVATVELPAAIARGCASTAWSVANYGVHHWMLALYDERAQREIWGPDPDALIASGIAFPQGRGRKVDGGFVIGGMWNFSSGVEQAGWNMLAAVIYQGEKAIDHRICILRRGEYEVLDDWHVFGMRGTGSRSVRAAEVFVPEHMAFPMYTAKGGATHPGAATNPQSCYRVPVATFASHCVGGVALGNAEAGLDVIASHVKQRSTSYTGLRMRDFQTLQMRVGMAGAKIEAARLLLRNDCLEGQRAYEDGAEALDLAGKLRHKRNLAYAVNLCTEAVDLLHAIAGANGIYDGHPMQRIFRDAHALAGHFAFSSIDAHLPPWGLVTMGGDYASPLL